MTDEATGQPEASAQADVNGAATAAAMLWPKKLPLRKPVIANGNEVMELSFREPTPLDIERCGDPARIDFFKGQPQVVYNDAAVTQMLSTLAAVPPSTIKSMHITDWKNARLLITIPFLEDLYLSPPPS